VSATYAACAPSGLECRIVITHWPPIDNAVGHAFRAPTFDLGIYDPVSGRYAPLGRHLLVHIDRIVRDLKVRIERERHLVTFSERTGPR
jgi:hypothetical protein